MKDLAPVVLFVYNRPWHTRQTLEALKQNELANDSRLYIFSDGPKEYSNDEELIKIKEVRDLIREEKWCGEVEIIERNENIGLANSVISGVSGVIEKHGRVIVLEDDIVTGKYFLKFMNDGLKAYESEKKVYGISGYQFSSSTPIKQTTYFLPIMSSWGYATWANRWSEINFNGKELLELVNSKDLEEKLDFGSLYFFQMLKDQVAGKNSSWAVRFYVSMFLKGGLFLYPNKSLLHNIGFDGTGVHSGSSPSLHYKKENSLDKFLKVKKKQVCLNDELVRNTKNGMVEKSFNNRIGIKKTLKKVLPPELIQFVRRKFRTQNSHTLKKELIPRYTKTVMQIKGKELVVPDLASFNFMKKEIFDTEIYKFITSNPNPYIIDCGANIGLSIIYLKSLYPDSKIVAFEPDPEIFQILKENVKKFSFSGVELIQKALWDKEKDIQFCAEGADGGLLLDVHGGKEVTNTVKAISLNSYLNEPVAFLKLDIEGAETTVLKDIQGKLINIERIFVEYHSFVGQRQTLNEIIDILTKANFRLHISSPGLTSSTPFIHLNIYNNMDMQLNIYGIKEEAK